MKKVVLFLALSSLFFACTQDHLGDPLNEELQRTLSYLAPDQDPAYFLLPENTDFSSIPQDGQNTLTEEKVALGKLLFFETGLGQAALHESGKETFSCATCHVPSAGFMPGRVQGIADGGAGFGINGEGRLTVGEYQDGELDVQGARPLSLLNVAYVTNTTWSGKFGAYGVNIGTEHLWGEDDPLTIINHLGLEGLESQNIEGLGLHRMEVNPEVVQQLGYQQMFDDAFPDFPEEERYSEVTASFAISAYLRCLTTTEAPFQRWLQGDQQAMTAQEKRGALLFFGKAGCYRCHQGPALNGNAFYALGVKDLYQTDGTFQTGPDDLRNLGRGGFTLEAEDMHKFKVPGIYNMADSPFYFHGSSHRSLWSVVRYFNNAIPENPDVPASQIAPEFQPLHLSVNEMEDLVEFLANGLRDPNLNRFVPEQVLSGNCFPNNDPVSQEDLGCD
jgi:cytochrome c peroxidase